MREATTTALLECLGTGDDPLAWGELDRRVRPVVHSLAKRHGLDDQRAADVAQETLLTFLRLHRAGRYERAKGRLGAWILGIAANLVRADLRRAVAQPRRLATTHAEGLPAHDGLTRVWEEESRNALLRDALRRLSEESRTAPATLQAFRLVFIDGRPPDEVARELGISVNSVYLAKNRCLARLRGILQGLETSWELGL